MPDVSLVIGKSESGKTTIAKHLLSSQNKEVRVVNDRTGDLDPRWLSVNWSELEGLENVAVLIEDMASATPSEFSHLQKFLSWNLHHANCGKVVINSFSLQKSNLQGILSHANKLIFTGAKTNVESLGVALSLARFPKQTKNEYLALFLACRQPYAYFVLDLDKRTFAQGPSILAAVGKDTKRAISRPAGEEGEDDEREEGEVSRVSEKTPPIEISRFLPHLSCPEKALLLYEVVKPHLGAMDDYHCVELGSKKSGVTYKINVIDYLECCTEEAKSPDRLMRGFHKWVNTKVKIPKCLITNKKMQ